MAKTLLLSALFEFFFSCIAIAQEYSYSHYDITDGLAGSTAYCITQDADGFIWTGTETGVSRFDGTHFKNFTTKDGLPDLEVLQIFGDSKGRVWMAPFRKSVCYYFQGKIHNQQNDTLLSRIHLQGNIELFTEDIEGNILLKQRNALHLVAKDGSIIEFDSLDHEPVSQCLTICRSASGYFLAQTIKKNITFSRTKCLNTRPFPLPDRISINNINDEAMNPHGIIFRDSLMGYKIWSFSKNKKIYLPIDLAHVRHISLSLLDDSLAYINESSGSIEYNINTGQSRTYLPGIPVSRILRDQAGDLWFTTMGKGIFRLKSSEWKTIRLTVENGESSMVNSITKIDNELWIGDNHNYIFRYALPGLALKHCRPYLHYVSNDRILYIDTIDRQ